MWVGGELWADVGGFGRMDGSVDGCVGGCGWMWQDGGTGRWKDGLVNRLVAFSLALPRDAPQCSGLPFCSTPSGLALLVPRYSCHCAVISGEQLRCRQKSIIPLQLLIVMSQRAPLLNPGHQGLRVALARGFTRTHSKLLQREQQNIFYPLVPVSDNLLTSWTGMPDTTGISDTLVGISQPTSFPAPPPSNVSSA